MYAWEITVGNSCLVDHYDPRHTYFSNVPLKIRHTKATYMNSTTRLPIICICMVLNDTVGILVFKYLHMIHTWHSYCHVLVNTRQCIRWEMLMESSRVLNWPWAIQTFLLIEVWPPASVNHWWCNGYQVELARTVSQGQVKHPGLTQGLSSAWVAIWKWRPHGIKGPWAVEVPCDEVEASCVACNGGSILV